MTHWPAGSPEHLLPRAHNVPLDGDAVSKRINYEEGSGSHRCY